MVRQMSGVQALLGLTNVFEAPERKHLHVSGEYCTRTRHRKSTCSVCVDSCPVGAMSFSDGLEVDTAKCKKCGVCGSVCPTGAIENRSPSDAELMESIKRTAETEGRLTIACVRTQEEHLELGSDVSIECLGRLDVSVLLAAALWGAKVVHLTTANCQNCCLSRASLTIETVIRDTNVLLEAAGESLRITSGDGVAGKRSDQRGNGPSFSRRAIFENLFQRAKQVSVVGVGALLPSKTGDKPANSCGHVLLRRVPEKRLATLMLLVELAGRSLKDSSSDSSYLPLRFGNPTINLDACTACGMCAYFCPTGALAKSEGKERVLIYSASRCTNCALCADICYRNAITVTTESSLRRVLDTRREAIILTNRPNTRTTIKSLPAVSVGEASRSELVVHEELWQVAKKL